MATNTQYVCGRCGEIEVTDELLERVAKLCHDAWCTCPNYDKKEYSSHSQAQMARLLDVLNQADAALVKVGEVPEWMEQFDPTWCQSCDEDNQGCGCGGTAGEAYRMKAEPPHRSNAWGES